MQEIDAFGRQRVPTQADLASLPYLVSRPIPLVETFPQEHQIRLPLLCCAAHRKSCSCWR